VSADIERWLSDYADFLHSQWGLDKSFSASAALLVLYLHYYGLSPVVTSGFRSPEKQQELLRRWESGDPSIKYKPATNSKHMHTGWLGSPASLAIDISTSNAEMAARIAKAIGVRAGYDFGDPVHFYI
jgi:hypothetical protein